MLDPKRAPVDVGVETSRSAWPRLLSRPLAAQYMSCSVREIDRLIAAGALGVVRLPVRRHQTNLATVGKNRRVLIDRLELDALAARNRQLVGR
jgi:hypothetical protein